MSTVGDPGAHGVEVTGIQGIGVSTPRAAAVAAATVGLARELHIPKGEMLTSGLLSKIFATGNATNACLSGKALNIAGATPKEHCNIAPPVTRLAK